MIRPTLALIALTTAAQADGAGKALPRPTGGPKTKPGTPSRFTDHIRIIAMAETPETHQRKAATIDYLIKGRDRVNAHDDAGDLVSGNGLEYQMRDLLVRAWFAGWLVPAPSVGADAITLWVALAPTANPDRAELHLICKDQDEAQACCSPGWRVGKFQEVPA